MELLKETIANVAVCSIVSAIVLAFVNKEKSEKAIRILMTLTLITIIVTPFTSYEDVKEEIFSYYKESETESYVIEKARLNETLFKKYELTVETIVGETLTKAGISDYEVKAKAEGYGEYGINITEVRIYLKDEYKDRHQEICEMVFKEIDFNAEIKYE